MAADTEVRTRSAESTPHVGIRPRVEAGWAAVTAVVAFLAAVPSLGLLSWDPSTPFGLGLDETSISMQLKTIHEHGWYWSNPDLGFPAGMTASWFPELNVLHVAAIKVIALVVGSGFTAGGLYFVAAFPLTGVTMYLLARSQGLSPIAGFVAGVLLANAPGHADRFGHLYLAQYWVVPVALWLVLEVGRGRPLWTGPVAGSRSRRTVVVAAVLVVGLSGAYYVGYTLLLLVAATLARRVVGAPRDLFRGLAVAVGLAVTIAVPLVLAKLGTAGDLVTGRVPATRLPSESEVFSGKLMDLLLPWPEHRLEPLAFLSQAYNGTTRATVEVSALGIVGVAGLVVLTGVGLAALLAGRRTDPALRHWSGLALVSFLLYTVGGLGSFIAFFGTPQLRTWSRMSLYLLVLALLAVGLLLTRLERRRGLVTALVVGGLVTVVGVADQTNPDAAPDHAAAATTMARLQDYVSTLQGATGPGCGVFQVPVVAYPESGPYLGMDDYDQLRPYLADSDLRFSAGAMRGTAASTWMRAVDVTDLAALGEQLRAAGFCALEVDTQGFTPEQDPSDRLRSAFGEPVASTVDEEFVAYRLPEGDVSDGRSGDPRGLLEPVLVTVAAYEVEKVGGVPGQKVGPVAGLSIANLTAETHEVTLTLEVTGLGAARRTVRVEDGGELLATAAVSADAATPLSVTVAAPRGLTTLSIEVSGPGERDPEGLLSTAFVSVVSATSPADVRVAVDQLQVATGWIVP
ncbi:hypothetical protein [uncultured Phycicoccus sp.]|uniref:hypothetical protein n=1 Tax=uncultured Phycicoccus sp. TaxID=661422 RepID=UPI0026044A4E|nr:hypothetical protein [uncultured Phycicoccus sp.]